MKTIDGFLKQAVSQAPDAPALSDREGRWTYDQLDGAVEAAARHLQGAGVRPGDRVAIYAGKSRRTVAFIWGAVRAGAVFVIVNPVLKAAQVAYILSHSGARALVSQKVRLEALEKAAFPDSLTLVDMDETDLDGKGGRPIALHEEEGLAALFYTSGSTGLPKGVMVSHANLVTGARAVTDYLGNTAADCLLAALPLSFDYGFSQLTTAFLKGASVCLIDYLMPRDILKAVDNESITGLALVPPQWIELADMDCSAAAKAGLRYATSSGGKMPKIVLDKLAAKLPETDFYVMYGLTEAFRSTYLPPARLRDKPDSVGIPVPHAQLAVVRPDGSLTNAGEEGELVHAGPLVTLGYWRDREATARRFRPAPPAMGVGDAPAVWSGDRMVRDEEGYFYFRGRADAMIKTRGYRVSPEEVEAVLLARPGVRRAGVAGLPHDTWGQAIAAGLVLEKGTDINAVRRALIQILPGYMMPAKLVALEELPVSPNGKTDRARLAQMLGGA